MTTPRLSFEIFPPASLTASFKLWSTMDKLRAFAPDFTSVTFGAQGARQDMTLDTARAIKQQTGAPVAAHLTIARNSKDDVLALADAYAEAGVRNIVALRGDAETPGAPFTPHADGFESSVDLVKALAARGKQRIFVGAYPESHPDAASAAQNIDFLKAKFDAGADAAITQFFFDPETFLRFRDAADKAGITGPIIPGILPVTNWARAKDFAARCGASVPSRLAQGFENALRDGQEDLFALTVASTLCTRLVEEGVDHLHIYTLNRAELTTKLATALGCAPKPGSLRNVA